MLISVNQDHVVTGYCEFGDNGLINPVTVSASNLPEKFSFVPNKYLYSDGRVIENPSYQPPKEEVKPTIIEQQLSQLQQMIMQLDQQNAQLEATKAQQATQIKQLQQMFMAADQQQAVEKSKEVTAQ